MEGKWGLQSVIPGKHLLSRGTTKGKNDVDQEWELRQDYCEAQFITNCRRLIVKVN